MPRLLLSAVLILCGFAASASASLFCSLTAVPLQTSAEGLAEPIGDILLRCAGGLPGQNVTGSMQVSVSRRISNAVSDSGAMLGVTLSLDTAVGFTPLPVGIRPLGNNILIENIVIPINAQGIFHVKISGIRAESGGETQAALQFSGSEQLLVQNAFVTVATSQPALLATLVPTTIGGAGPAVPDLPDFSTLVSSGARVATVRITEGFAAAFNTRRSDATNGMRVLIRLAGLPSGVRVFAPDAIAGSSASVPTLTGALGNAPTPGQYNPLTGSSLLLSRVRGAGVDGSRGSLAFIPGSGAQVLFGVSEADPTTAIPYLVYEVFDAKPSELETAQIPIWLFPPTDRSLSFTVVRPSVALAPVADPATPASDAPVPRYRPNEPAGDCTILRDCQTAYFPIMEVTPTATTSYTIPSGAPAQTGNILVRNNGGGLMEWRASVRYRGTTGWLTISPEFGYGNSTLRYDVSPGKLAQGRYEAEILVQLLGSPSGTTQDVAVPVTMEVTAALPPPPPPVTPPTVTDVISPGIRYGMPFAPGALAVLLGTEFSDRTTVTVGGLAARIILVNPGELTLEIPPTLTPGLARVVASNNDRPGISYAIDIVPISPDTLFVLNSDEEVNSPDRPVEAGATLQIYFTGTRAAAQPLSIKIHERFLDAESQLLEQPGVELVKITVPADFPTMPSEIRVCAKPAAGADAVCSYPKAIWIKAAPK